jgi:hypothetical protein
LLVYRDKLSDFDNLCAFYSSNFNFGNYNEFISRGNNSMKAEIRELIADLKAAIWIGHPESLQVALDGYRGMPEISGNAALSQAFLKQAILPLGEVLASPRLDIKQIDTLLDDPLAGVRALGAVAVAGRFLAEQGVVVDDLDRPARDQRAEVRIALGETLVRQAGQNPKRLQALVSDWFGESARDVQSSRLRHSGLIALRGLIPDFGDEVLTLLANLPTESDREVRLAHSETLISVAESGREEAVYRLLVTWSAEDEPDTWMIAKTLSAAWAARDLSQSEAILQALERRVGEDRAIERAKRSLARHGKSS